MFYDRKENSIIGTIPLSQANKIKGFNKKNFTITSNKFVSVDIYFVAFNTYNTKDAINVFNKYLDKINQKNKLVKISSSHGHGFEYRII
jgi:hypothetical protein